MNKTIGECIRAARLKRGLTTQELAYDANLSMTTVSKAERGEHIPTLDTVLKICKALECDIKEVIPEWTYKSKKD